MLRKSHRKNVVALRSNKLIKEKGLIFYPIMMAVGGFPDDALVCMAGVTKMNLIYFIF